MSRFTVTFPPSTDPLYRLHVYDGLMMNAHRWLLFDQYHRRRQNLHYQSLNQPGIVFGLGIRLIEPPKDAALQEPRWIEIQPGIAIDAVGNLIIVEQPIAHRIAVEPPKTGALTVYLFISYLEFEQPHRQPPRPEMKYWILTDEHNAESIREWFQIDEKTEPLDRGKEIELCRIQVAPQAIRLMRPENVFNPGINHLDFRYRPIAQPKPQSVVRVAQLQQSSGASAAPPFKHDLNQENLLDLLRSLPALYPVLQGIPEIAQVTLRLPETLQSCALLHLTDWELCNLKEADLNILMEWLKQGGTMIVEGMVEKEGGIGGNAAEENLVKGTEHPSLQTAHNIQTAHSIITQQMSVVLQHWRDFSPNPLLHCLRTQPFHFAVLPKINQQPIEVWVGQGVILIAGELSAAWGIGDGLTFDRSDIRTAQEFGINLLHLAVQRWQMTQLCPVQVIA